LSKYTDKRFIFVIFAEKTTKMKTNLHLWAANLLNAKNFAAFFVTFLLFSNFAYAQKAQRLMPEKTRILFVLDGSGSMRAEWDGTQRMNIAKLRLGELIDSLRVNPNVELALRVYGHQFPPKAQNCQDSKLEVPFKARNNAELKNRLMQIDPKGVTPIAYSLEQATKDFPEDRNYRNLIIMITDGLESCKGDPCAIALGLQKKGILLKPYIIGLGVGKDFTQAFSCMGKAYDARSSADFKNLLGSVIRQTLGKTTISVELQDIGSQNKETNVNMTFINRVTGEAIYDLVHWRDNKGQTDELEIDAAIDYDIIVNTLPAVKLENAQIEGGRHNVIKIKTPQGGLKFSLRTSSEYGNIKAIVRKSGEMKTLYAQKMNIVEDYLVGKYDVEILTVPRIYKTVEVKQSSLTDIFIESPGLLNLNSLLEGYYSIYQIDNNQPVWVDNVEVGTVKSMAVALQPGNYKIVIRAKEAKGSVYTIVKKFSITTGGTVSMDILK
jgi:Ca-activated chloride channel homolog